VALVLGHGEVRPLTRLEAGALFRESPTFEREWEHRQAMTQGHGRLKVINPALVEKIVSDLDSPRPLQASPQ
jgi:hypothetical protein